MIDKEKLEKIKRLADAMYNAAFNITTDASRLKKAMYDYHQFIIYEYYKEEPVSNDLEDFAKKESESFAEREYEIDYIDRNALAKGYYWGCIAGAQWQKEQMISKACEWLSNVSIEDMTYKYNDFDTSEDWYKFIEDFKKAMGE